MPRKKMIFLIFFVVYVLPIKADMIPVLLWGSVAEEKPALQALQSQEFEKIINGLLQNSMIVTFADDQLDFRTLRSFRKTDKYLFSYLRSRPNKTFYMNIESPLKILTNQKIESKKFSDLLKEQLKCIVGSKHVIDIGNEATNDLWKYRDEKMKIVAKSISHCPVVYVYTAKNSIATQHKLHRVKRDQIHVIIDNVNFIIGGQILMAWHELLLYENKRKLNVTFTHVDVKVEKFDSLITMSLEDDRTLHLHFLLTHGYYVLKHIDISGKKFLIREFEIPESMSFACNKLYGFQQSTSNYLEWYKFQLQIFKKPIKSNKIHFTTPWNCDGFVTPTILSGLICASIMLAIGFCGVTWMMDIHNMDSFDDPSGKALELTPKIDD